MKSGLLIKRLFDLIGGAALFVITSPVLLLASAAVVLTIGRPVWFRQLRSGLNGKPFQIYKIRTMRGTPGGESGSADDNRRLTRLGRLLRRTSIDELPQFWNVLRGEMSLVGPRPLLYKYVTRYTALQARRLEAKPGITGWAQIEGRNGITWEKRFELDVWYIEHRSVWLDLLILLRTPVTVSRMANISAPGEATIREFRSSSRTKETAVPVVAAPTSNSAD